MAIKHFIRKELRLLADGRVTQALKTGSWETFWWALEKSPLQSNWETPIWHRDGWDICVVLDATRIDLFREVALEYDWLPDYIDYIWSVGSASPEWIGETFRPERHDDWKNAGYVTANPFSCKPNDRAAGSPPGALPLEADELTYLDEVWRDQWINEPISTVRPGIVAKRGLWAWNNKDMNQLVMHFMQPHIPFRSRPEWFGKRENLQVFGEPGKEGEKSKDVWKELRDGKRDREEVWNAYADNLRWGLEWVNWLRRRTDATICITSDHGNGLGEYGVWSHPPNNMSPHLRRVPFVLIEGTNELAMEGPVSGKPPVTENTNDTGSINEQLAALGYRSQ